MAASVATVVGCEGGDNLRIRAYAELLRKWPTNRLLCRQAELEDKRRLRGLGRDEFCELKAADAVLYEIRSIGEEEHEWSNQYGTTRR